MQKSGHAADLQHAHLVAEMQRIFDADFTVREKRRFATKSRAGSENATEPKNMPKVEILFVVCFIFSFDFQLTSDRSAFLQTKKNATQKK